MKEIIKSFLGSFAALLVFGLGAFLLILIFIAAAASGDSVTVPRQAVLTLDLGRPISDRPFNANPDDLILNAISGGGEKSVQLRTLKLALRAAAKDKRIKGLLIQGNVPQAGFQSGWAALLELRSELERFKESGKTVVAYNRVYGEPDYYLASLADTVYLHPLGAMEFNGMASERMFFARAMEKYGIEADILRVGRFKSAVEPYMLDRMSPAAREQTQTLLQDLIGVFLQAVSTSRELPMEELQAIAQEKALLKSSDALECRLIDDITYFDEVRARLQTLTESTDEKDFPQVSIADYSETLSQNQGGSQRIAVIYAEGEIVDGDNQFQVGGDTIAEMMRKAREDDKVKAVVLRVNSPGGSALASEVIQHEARLVQAAGKPLVVSMGTVAASGGYWISTYADEIVAQPTTITGSIGVFGLLLNFQRAANDHGFTFDTVKTHHYADMGSIFRSKAADEVAILQTFVDQIYDQFLTKVAEGRDMAKEEVHEIAQGRVWSGVQAQKLGLVDTLGGFETAVEAAAKKAGLEENDYRLFFYQREKTLSDTLVELINESDASVSSSSPMQRELHEAILQLRRLTSMDDPLGVYARLEFDWAIR